MRSFRANAAAEHGVYVPAPSRRGFTLLEILVGVTIFGIISVAIYSTFRAGLKSYESGREQMVITQTARTVFELLGRDLRSLHYEGPRTYNQNLIAQIPLRAIPELQFPQGPRRRGQEGSEEDRRKPPMGLPVDLTIIGEDQEQCDALTFVTYQPQWRTEPTQPWGLARVKYFVQEGVLFRAEGPITVEDIPPFQWQGLQLAGLPDALRAWIAASSSPMTNSVESYLAEAPREMVARDVKTFDLRYGYWTPEGWYEAPTWIAHEHQYRNPPYALDPTNPNAFLIMQRNLHRPTDDIPAYVAVSLAFAFGKDGSRTQLFRTRIRLMNSSETHEPLIEPVGFPTMPPGIMPPGGVPMVPAPR